MLRLVWSLLKSLKCTNFSYFTFVIWGTSRFVFKSRQSTNPPQTILKVILNLWIHMATSSDQCQSTRPLKTLRRWKLPGHSIFPATKWLYFKFYLSHTQKLCIHIMWLVFHRINKKTKTKQRCQLQWARSVQ